MVCPNSRQPLHQNGHGKIEALTTHTYRPRYNLNRFQVLDINHKSKVPYSSTLITKLDKFIHIDFMICRIQFSKSKIGLDMSLVFNVASKNLCGKTRPYRMLNTTAKNNENSGKNNLKHALNYLLHLFMILGGLFKSPNILNIIYDQKLSPRGYDYMKSNRVGHNLIINGISYIILLDFKSKKFNLLTLWQLLKLIYGHNEIVKFYDTIKSNNMKALSIKNDLEFTNSYIISLINKVHKFKKNSNSQYDSIGSIPVFYIYKPFISLRMNARSLGTYEPRGKSGKEYLARATKSCGLDISYHNFKNYFFVFKEVLSENSILMHGLILRAASNQERPMMAGIWYLDKTVMGVNMTNAMLLWPSRPALNLEYLTIPTMIRKITSIYDYMKSNGIDNNMKINGNGYILMLEIKFKKYILVTAWQFLELIYCQYKIVKNYDIIKSGKQNKYKSHVLSNDNRNALTIKCELESDDSNILCRMIRFYQRNKISANKRQYDSIGTIPVFYMYKHKTDLRLYNMPRWFPEPGWKSGNDYRTRAILSRDLDIFYFIFRNHFLVFNEDLSEIKSRLTNSRIVTWIVPSAGRRFNCCQQNKLSKNSNG